MPVASNAQKLPLPLSLNKIARARALEYINLTGRQLPSQVVSVPSSGKPIVKVKFLVNSPFTIPQVTMPVFGPEYIRYPLQPGDMGLTLAGDASLSGINGLGTGTADLSMPANLAALVFLPIGNMNFVSVDGNKVVIYGINGVVIQDKKTSPGVQLTLTDTEMTVVIGSTRFAFTASGLLVTGGDILADTISLKNHSHSGVTPGGGDTGPPVP